MECQIRDCNVTAGIQRHGKFIFCCPRSMSRLAPVAVLEPGRRLAPPGASPLGGRNWTSHSCGFFAQFRNVATHFVLGILEIPIMNAVVFPSLPHHSINEFDCHLQPSSPPDIQSGSTLSLMDCSVSCALSALEPVWGSCFAWTSIGVKLGHAIS